MSESSFFNSIRIGRSLVEALERSRFLVTKYAIHHCSIWEGGYFLAKNELVLVKLHKNTEN